MFQGLKPQNVTTSETAHAVKDMIPSLHGSVSTL